MNQQTTTNIQEDRQFVVDHTFNIPATKVFSAYTDPHLLSQWWASKDSKFSIRELDVRPGGEYRFVEEQASGIVLTFFGTYLDVQPGRRLVYTFNLEGLMNDITATIDLKESEGKTLLTFTNRFTSKEARDMMLGFGAKEGAEAAFKRLDEVLSQES
jgi:uncharacterized protein YndB with AHSA1/START domain